MLTKLQTFQSDCLYNAVMTVSILLVSANSVISNYLSEILRHEDFSVQIADSGVKALEFLDIIKADVTILDLDVQDTPDVKLLQGIRDEKSALNIVLIKKSDLKTRLRKLGLTESVHLTKPFALWELVKLIKNHLQKSIIGKSKLTVGDLMVDTGTRQVVRGKDTIRLTKTEFDLLVHLIVNANRVQSREALLNHVWGYNADVKSRVIDVYIGYLKNKIEKTGRPQLIQNIRGIGYILKNPA
ncbi:hypothetical protein A2154_04110 [Candidatus Gottesmanbacteria bacterium RBG_16_43_7]|uniref:DNA-binding response regulator n=1 Tax=Candidatus Gottesmanbacteria bacterium RBG_16_43_7 TaxID=1798373 RepID=A0A1F5Z8T7_9BACT|nr:MAG: hypothetical protein A2154_04110 [Candidatus Gottesmanbacteria bacterium RBG_16_43_7]